MIYEDGEQNDSNDRLFYNSLKNPFLITSEISDYSRRIISNAINYIGNYFDAEEIIIEKEKTYEIDSKGKIIKVASFDTTIVKKDLRKCTIEISNPLNFEGSRYWMSFFITQRYNNGAIYDKRIVHWTDENSINANCPSPDYLFNIFSRNYDWNAGKYESTRKKKANNEKMSADDLFFSDDIYDNVVHNDIDVTNLDTRTKEELLLKTFEKMFNKQKLL